jgi:predicted secreted protein
MKMKKTVLASLIVVVSLALAVGCAGCTSSTTPSPSPSTTTTAVGSATVARDAAAELGGNNATSLRDATNLTAVQGQNFTIQLESNPSTGYHWVPSYNSSVTLVNQTYVAGSVSVPGAPGADVFTFQGTQTGTSVIAFKYMSPANVTTSSINYTITCTTLITGVTVNAVYVSQGRDFTTQLQSNPSTGYHWELSLYDNSTLKLVNQTVASNVSTSSAGAGGMDLFTFQATHAGTGGIIFTEISPANQTTSAVVYSVIIPS